MISTAFFSSAGTDTTFSGIHNPGLGATVPWFLESGTEYDKDAALRFFWFEAGALPNSEIGLRDGLYVIEAEIISRGFWAPGEIPPAQQLYLTGRLQLVDGFTGGGGNY